MRKGAHRPAALIGLFAVAVTAGTAGALVGPAAPAAASSVPGIQTLIHLTL